ncbi:hypothetical protein EON80_11585, partial [bacterium]
MKASLVVVSLLGFAVVAQADSRVDGEVARIVKAYEKVGDFSVSSLDTGNGNRRRYCTGRFARDGRVAFTLEDRSSPS